MDARRSLRFLFAGYESLGIGVFLAALPIIGGVVLTHRLYLRHIEDTELAQQQRVATAEREAAEAARHLEELQKSENRFQKAFAHAAIGMALVAHDRTLLQANPALCEILGRAPDELLGSDFGAFVHRDDHALLAGELAQLIAGTTRLAPSRFAARARVATSSPSRSTHPPSSRSPTRTRPASSSRCRT